MSRDPDHSILAALTSAQPIASPTPHPHTVDEGLRAAIDGHPSLGVKGIAKLGGGQIPLYGNALERPARFRLNREEPAKVLEWLLSLGSRSSAGVRYVSELWGIKSPPGGVVFCNGVKAMPWEELPDSRMKRHVAPSSEPLIGLGKRMGLSALVLEREESAGSQNSVAVSEISEVARALNIIPDTATTMGVRYCEFLDPDLEIALAGAYLTHPPTQHLREAWLFNGCTGDACEFVDAFLKLETGKVRNSISYALDALGRAKRGHDDSRAIECCTCLDAIFGSLGGESTYRVQVRAAVRLAVDLAEGKVIAKHVEQLFNDRNKLVHGKENHLSNKLGERIAMAIGYCERALRMAVQDGSVHHSVDDDLRHFIKVN